MRTDNVIIDIGMKTDKPEKKKMSQVDLFNIILDEGSLTWESLLYDIVQKEKLDPWDLDLSILANKYVNKIKHFKQLNFKLSGKVILAAAILLKMKSDRVLLDELFAVGGRKREELIPTFDFEKYGLEPHVPLPRERNVTLKELVVALRKALEIKNKRVERKDELKREINVILTKYDIQEEMAALFEKILKYIGGKEKIEFFDLIDIKEDIALTFIPLIHLANNKRVCLDQEELFGPLYIQVDKNEENS